MRRRIVFSDLGRWIDPGEAFVAICGDHDGAFWLDSGPDAVSGVSYLGVAAEVTLADDVHGPFLEWLRREQAALAVDALGVDGFGLGWVVWLGYELHAETMSTSHVRESTLPRAAALRVERMLAFDHARRTVTLVALDDDEGWRGEVELALAGGSRRARPPEAVRLWETGGDAVVTWADTDDDYLQKIAACQTAIRNGEAYQLCLTTEATVNTHPDPVETYLALRASSPSHHGGFVSARGVSLLSASPEQFLAVSPDGIVQSKPIKGTRPRGTDDATDSALRDELLASDKERAENLMIVDLMRNDIGRVCRVGSVEVTSLLAVETYAHVHQLVSTIRGRLAEGLDTVDAITACFPAGSMTGAPKRSAMTILDSLEGRARGIYSGAFGYLGFDGALDLAMVIRSIVLDEHGATVGAGGGITALSVPHEEVDEVRLKAAALLRVLGAR